METLTLEQRFAIRSFETQMAGINLEQARELLVDLYRQMLLKDNSYQALLKKEWGIEPMVLPLDEAA